MKTNRKVLVTGAAGGMGAAFVQRFLENGDEVFATDTSAEALQGLAAKAASNKLHVQVADIVDEAALAALADRTEGRVDVLVNVAGHFPVQKFTDMTADDWRKVIDINLTGTALVCKAMLPSMLGRGWGRIVNIGSASVYSGVAGQAHYVAAKAGMIGLSRSLARELGPEGITVNVVAPGVTITETARKTLPKQIQEEAIDARCIAREEKAADLVGTVFFLASPDADFVSGQTIIVDGGNEMI